MKYTALNGIGQIIVLLIVTFSNCATDASAFFVQHDLTIELRPEKNELIGYDVLTIDGWEERFLEFVLAPQARIQEVFVGDNKVPFAFEAGRLRIETAVKQRPKTLVKVAYTAQFNDSVPRNPLQTEDPSYGVTGVISHEGTFLLAGAGWYPDLSLAASRFRVSVKGPAGYEAVTAGNRVSRELTPDRATSVWEIGEGHRGLALSAGPYMVRERDVDGITVYAYFFPEEEPFVETYMNATARYLRLYNQLFGPYPFDKFAVVENFFPTGYGFPSYTLLGRSVMRLPFIVETSLGHEVAHSWWGNGVFVDYSKGNWSEGLTTYVADYLYKEQSSPQEGRDYRLKVLRDHATLVSPDNDFPLRLFMGRVSPSSRVIGYGKTAMVFHMARRLVGDDAFWNGLKTVYQEKVFKRASWGDFADALSQTGKKDLAPFFQQWVARAGAPRLHLTNVTSKRAVHGWQIQGTIGQTEPLYDLLIPVALKTNDRVLIEQVALSGKSADFSIKAEAPPQKLTVDPDYDLFRQLEPAEIPTTTNSIKGSTSLVVVSSKDLPADILDTSALLLEALGHKGLAVVSEDQALPSIVQGKDVLYLGVPRNRSLLSPPKGVTFDNKRFEINGNAYDDPGDAFFMVFSTPEISQRAIALFLPLSQDAASQVIRKIPHYGKYSYLVFRGGVNQAKGTWPVLESSLIYHFNL